MCKLSRGCKEIFVVAITHLNIKTRVIILVTLYGCNKKMRKKEWPFYSSNRGVMVAVVVGDGGGNNNSGNGGKGGGCGVVVVAVVW